MASSKTSSKKLLSLAGKTRVLRPRDLAPLGIPRVVLYREVERGTLERVGRGLYMSTGAEVGEFHALAEAATRVPRGIVCLLSALRFHGLGTQAPFEVWMAIHPDARKPRVDYPPIRIVRFSGRALAVGVETHRVEGVEVRVTSLAKTVADCFKYRNKIGLDVAIEALKDYRHARRGTISDLLQAAHACRVARVILPYLEMTT